MYKCQKCGDQSKPGEKAVMQVVETAPIEHLPVFDRKRDAMSEGGRGTRIVREIKVHPTCAS